MSTAIKKIKNPYGIEFELSFNPRGEPRGLFDDVSGCIVISGKEYHLDAISKDILDCLATATEDEIFNILPQEVVFRSVDDLPEGIREEALEVKLRLMACINFQGMDKANRSKLAIIEEYHKLRQREQKRHFDQMNEIELWLKEELEKIGE